MDMIRFDKDGETPLDDISGLKIKSIKTRQELDNAEAENILKPTLKYIADPSNARKIKFDIKSLKKLHKEMFGDVWSWAGEFRTTQTSVGVEPFKINTDLIQLLDDLSCWEKNWDYKETAMRLHHALVKIHPFSNGNGRWARLVTDIWLVKNGKKPIEWGSDELVLDDSARRAYINALKSADRRDYKGLSDFMF